MIKHSFFYKTLVMAAAAGFSVNAALAQGFVRKDQALPDASRFYMSRLQVQMIDEAPVVTRQANPGGAAGGQSMIPGVPPGGLPRAGFQSYSPSMPQLSTSLPKTNNGVPPKLAPGKGPSGMKGQAGKLGSAKPKGAPTSSPVVQAYAPYKGYEAPPVSSSYNNSTRSAVRGSVLHWARGQH